MRYFVTVLVILLISFFGVYYLKSKNIIQFKSRNTNAPKSEEVESAGNADPLEQIREYSGKIEGWENMFAEIKDVLNNVKQIQEEVIKDDQ